MKKHIIIAGVPRAGKSTAAQRIAHTFGYQHISMDSVIAGIETAFPETGMDTEAPVAPEVNLAHISARMAPFLRAMTDSGEYDECDYGMVIDIYQLLPQDYLKHIDPEVCEIYYFVTADVTPEERYEILKAHDTSKDYTYFLSDDEKLQECVDVVKLSKIFKEQCTAYGLPCYETARNREQVLDQFIHSIQ